MPDYRPHGPLGMGTAPMGNLITEVPDADAIASAEAAWEAGVRHFDTAPHYGAGLAEHRLGRVLRTRRRDDYTLSTKIGRILHADDSVPTLNENFLNALPFRRSIDYSAAGTIRSLEDSQQRMGLTRFDIVYIHDCSEDWHGPAWKDRFAEAMAGAARELSAQRNRGQIKAWGMGLNMVEPALACLEAADPDVFLIAGRYTLIDHTALARLFPACAAKGVKVVLGGPYNSGLLAGGTTFNYEPAQADIVARAQAVRAICERHGVDIRAAALQFCAAHPVVAAVIPGPRSATEAAQNAKLMRTEIPGQLWRDLRHAGLLPEEAPTPEP